MLRKRVTSRTANLTYKTCARKRFFGFEFGGHGVSSPNLDLNLETGSCVHRGLQNLLEHCRTEHPFGDFEEKCIDYSVDLAIDLWRTDLTKSNGISLHYGEDLNIEFIINEHETLVEGLIRAFAIKRLRDLLMEYEVLEVECEEIFEDFSESVAWLSKSDALFKRRVDGKLVVLSIKTTSEYPDPNEDQPQNSDVVLRNILHDMQGCSEWYSTQNRIDNLWNNKGIGSHLLEGTKWSWILDYKSKPEVFAVQYEHLVTGKRRKDSDKIYRRQTPLVHPQKFAGQASVNFFSMHTIKFEPDNYKWKWGKGKQPKGWEKINIWEDIGIKMWIDLLAQGKIQSEEGDFLANIIRTSELIIRTPEELEEWLVSTAYQEESIAEDLFNLAEVAKECKVTGLWKNFEFALMKFFPKNTQNCHDYYGHDCQFVNICHPPNMELGECLESGQFKIRHPHHEEEEKQFIEKGYIKDEKEEINSN